MYFDFFNQFYHPGGEWGSRVHGLVLPRTLRRLHEAQSGPFFTVHFEVGTQQNYLQILSH